MKLTRVEPADSRSTWSIYRAALFVALAAVAATGAVTRVRDSRYRTARSSPSKPSMIFRSYVNKDLGFLCSRPDFWSVRPQGLSVQIANPARDECVLVEAFEALNGQTAAQYLENLGSLSDGRFFQATVNRVKHINANGDESEAALQCQGADEPVEIRAVCSIVGGKGLLCVIASSTSDFAADRPNLVRIVRSVRFVVPAKSGISVPTQTSFRYWVQARLAYPDLPDTRGFVDGRASRKGHGSYRIGSSPSACGEQALFPDINIASLTKD